MAAACTPVTPAPLPATPSRHQQDDRRGKRGHRKITRFSRAPQFGIRHKSAAREQRIALWPLTAHAAGVGVVEEGGLLKGAGPIGGPTR